jgi:hypothetical protein
MSSPEQIGPKHLERLKQHYHDHINSILEPIASSLPDHGDPNQRTKIAGRIIFSACFTFIFGVIIGAFQIYGVINAGLAHTLIFIAWLFTVLAVWAFLPSEPKKYIHRLLFRSALVLAFVFLALDLLMIYLKPIPELPDVSVEFFDPDAPTVLIKNQSNFLARNVRYQTVIFNLELPLEPPALRHPLPIVVEEATWIKAHDEIGPNAIFATPHVRPLLKPGDRLVGTIAVNCDECTRGRTYYVFIKWGQNGWYSEIKDEKSGRNRGPAVLREGILEAYLKDVESRVPIESRMPIRSR